MYMYVRTLTCRMKTVTMMSTSVMRIVDQEARKEEQMERLGEHIIIMCHSDEHFSFCSLRVPMRQEKENISGDGKGDGTCVQGRFP